MRLTVGIAAIALALTACTASPEPTASSPSPSAPAPSPSVSVSTPAEPTQSPTAQAIACPTWSDDLDEDASTIGPISFAGVCVGQSFDEAIATGAPVTSPEQCPWYGQLVQMEDPGFYVTALSDPGSPGASIGFFVMYWFGDPLDAPSWEIPTTAEGISIGSSAAAVKAAYPAATEVSFDDLARGPRTQLVVPTGPATTYNFDIVDGVVTEMSWGEGLSAGGPNGDLCAL